MSQNNDTILLDDRGLVGEWLLDGNANDTSGNGYNGTASNVTYAKTDRGYQSQCGVFNGSSSKVDLPTFSLTSDWTVSFVCNGSTSNFGIVLNLINNADNTNLNIDFDGTTSKIRFVLWNGAGGSTVIHDTPLSVSQKYFVTMQREGTVGRIFVDGVLVKTQTVITNTIGGDACSIGYNRRTNARYVNTPIQSVRIFNRALSATEIRNRYLESLRMLGGSSLHGLMDGLVAYLDSSDGNELSDIVGGKDATKVSGTATTDNLGFTRAITNPNYTFPSITYTNVYSYENSGAGWGLVANPAGISATAINRTTTFRLALFFDRALSASEQTAWAYILSKRYVLPFDVDGRKGLPIQLRNSCKLWLTGEYSGTTAFDASGNGNHGTLVNSPTPKRRGGYKGWSFNGTSTKQVVPGNASLTISESTPFSVCITANTSLSGTQTICSNASTSTNVGTFCFFIGTVGTNLNCEIVKRAQIADGIIIPITSKLNRICLTYDGTTAYAYVNGRKVGQVNRSFSGATNYAGDINIGDYVDGNLFQNGISTNVILLPSTRLSDIDVMNDFINFFIPSP